MENFCKTMGFRYYWIIWCALGLFDHIINAGALNKYAARKIASRNYSGASRNLNGNVTEFTCEGFCGVLSPYNNTSECHCDVSCVFFNDCCGDFDAQCLSSFSCADRCGDAYDSDKECQCDDVCHIHDNCCEDWDICPVTGSCSGRCNNPINAEDTCGCTSDCEQNGDCCSDYTNSCIDSCVSRCDENFSPGSICYCNEECKEFKDCCSDYDSQCQLNFKNNEDGDSDALAKTGLIWLGTGVGVGIVFMIGVVSWKLRRSREKYESSFIEASTVSTSTAATVQAVELGEGKP